MRAMTATGLPTARCREVRITPDVPVAELEQARAPSDHGFESTGWALLLPLLIVDEADVLRDEGEAYAAKLRQAGVPVTTVRYDGTCHDFMLLNALSQTKATRAAIAQATAFLREAFGSD
jgi:acetyl esterase/lipase